MATTDGEGLEYAPGIVGKHLFRVRESYLAETIAPLVAQRRYEAAKLDLVLRGVGLLPAHAGKRPPGMVLRLGGKLSYEALHDLVRNPRHYSTGRPEHEDFDADVVAKKRKWVGEQLQVLEGMDLLRRDIDRQGRRPDITVLCDLRNKDPFDDPGAQAARAGNSYVTIFGSVLASEHFRRWGAPELVGYLCCMVADRFAADEERRKNRPAPPVGGARWYRQAEWFNNANGHRKSTHVVLPFSTNTIRRGLQELAGTELLSYRRTRIAPDGARMQRSRNVYHNHFDEIGAGAKVVDLAAAIAKAG